MPDDCPGRPLSMNVSFPMSYLVLYSNGDLLNTTVVDIGRCAMAECSTPDGPCSQSNVICCCQPVVYTELQYFTDNDTSVIYDMVVSVCGCLPCNATVSFVGAVVRGEATVPLASLVVDQTLPLLTDRYGFFEAVVSPQGRELTVVPREYGYASFNYTYQVVLGVVNIVEVDLVPVATSPSSTDGIVLDMMGSSGTVMDPGEANSLVQFPPMFFSDIDECFNMATGQPDNCIIQYIPVDMGSDDSVLKFRLDFQAVYGDGSRSKRQTNVPRCVSVLALGWLQVYDDSRQDVVTETSRGMDIITFVASSLQFAQSLQVYQYTSGGVFAPLDNTALATEVEDGVEVTFHLTRPPLPLTYIVGTEVGKPCYTVARVFRMRDGEVDREREPRYSVAFVTRTASPKTVNVVRGHSKECVAIPCSGDLSITVQHYGTLFYPDTVQYSLTFPTLPGPVYISLDDCTVQGALSDNAMLYFSFIEATSLPDTRPLDTLIAEDASIYCYIQLEAYACANHYIRVMVTSQQGGDSGDAPVDRVRYLSSISSTQELGSGTNCLEKHVICMEYDCDASTDVTVSVVQCGKDSCSPQEYESCLPAPYAYNLSPLISPSATYNSVTVSNTRGTFSSTHNTDIAYYKCRLTTEAALVFQCSIDY